MNGKVNSRQGLGDRRQIGNSRQGLGDRRQIGNSCQGLGDRQKTRFRNFLIFIERCLSAVLCRLSPIACCLLFTHCQAPTEGCLDLRATNFDVTASKACDKACTCTYPALIVSANYKMGTSDFYIDSTYTNDMSQKFRIVSTQMYLSDFQLINEKNDIFRTIDSSILTRATDTIRVLNNYALVGKTVGFDFTIGTFNGTGTFKKLKFRLGLDDVAAKAVPSKMPLTSPLSTKTDSMYITPQKQYIFNKFVIAKGTNFKDTLRLNILTPTDKEITFSKSFTEGSNVKIPLTINYLNFFKGVDFTATQKLIEDKIVLNTPTVFSIQ